MSIERQRRGREEDYPAFLLIEEAAELLRISRGKAYGMARRYRETDGAEGLPVVDLGHALRVPVDLFEERYGPLPGWFLAKRAAAMRAKEEATDAKAQRPPPADRLRVVPDVPVPADQSASPGKGGKRAKVRKAGTAHPEDSVASEVEPGATRGAPRRRVRHRPPSGQLSLLEGWPGADPEET